MSTDPVELREALDAAREDVQWLTSENKQLRDQLREAKDFLSVLDIMTRTGIGLLNLPIDTDE